MIEGTVPLMVRPKTRDDLKSYKVRIAAKNYSEAIEQLLRKEAASNVVT